MKIRIVHNKFLEEVATLVGEGSSVRVRINGSSMYPFIKGGKDEVELAPYHKGMILPLWTCVFFRWNDSYVIHRYIGKEKEYFCFMGDGNLAQVEKVKEKDILGILQTIYHHDGTEQNCFDPKWLNKGEIWYRCRKFRRFLLPLLRRVLG